MKNNIKVLSVPLLCFGLFSCATPPKETTPYPLKDLAQRSAIVVSGKVLKINASEEPLLKASADTAVINVSHMYAGTEIAGDQTGRNITAILRQPRSLKVGTEAMFFGNPRFVGKSLTMVDEDEVPFAKLAETDTSLQIGLQARRDKPVLERLSSASSVFLGKVESEKPLDGDMDKKDQSRELTSEHNPEWHVAAVRVITPLRGGDKDTLVLVIYPASRDIMWFNSPKLKPGQDGVFITHNPAKGEEELMRTTGVTTFINKQPAVMVTQPFDVLPASDEARVRGLLAKEVQ